MLDVVIHLIFYCLYHAALYCKFCVVSFVLYCFTLCLPNNATQIVEREAIKAADPAVEVTRPTLCPTYPIDTTTPIMRGEMKVTIVLMSLGDYEINEV